jgi:hypothetical protein
MKAIACTLGVMLAAATWTAPATALDITFESVEGAGNPIVATLEVGGYRFTADSLQIVGVPGGTYVSNASAVYIARTLTTPGGITLVRTDGTPFVLYEFDAAGPFVPPSDAANVQRLDLLGTRSGGGTLSASYDLSGLSGFGHFTVPVSWNDLASVTFAGISADAAPAALALDDVGVGLGPGSPVAEPTSLLLALTTAVAMGAVMLHRRIGRPARRH